MPSEHPFRITGPRRGDVQRRRPTSRGDARRAQVGLAPRSAPIRCSGSSGPTSESRAGVTGLIGGGRPGDGRGPAAPGVVDPRVADLGLARRRAADRRAHHGGSRPVRLTRRGRLALLITLIVMACAAVGTIAVASQAAEPAKPSPTIVVGPGDTLWSVAARQLPSEDRFSAIEEIRRLNHLDGYTVYAGQRLRVPAHR